MEDGTVVVIEGERARRVVRARLRRRRRQRIMNLAIKSEEHPFRRSFVRG